MTVREMMTKVFQLSGEPSDLCPYVTPGDPATFDLTLGVPGATPLLEWINQAIVRIANWEYPDGTILRFKHLRKNLYWKAFALKAGDVLSGTVDSINVDGFNPLNRNGQFTGWVVEVVDSVGLQLQKRLVIRCTGDLADNSVLTVHQDWDVVPDSTWTYRLYKRFFEFVPVPVAGSVDDFMAIGNLVDDVADVLRIRDLISGTDLAQPKHTELFTSTLLTKAIPSLYMVEGNRVTFDSPWDLGRSYEMLYYAHPQSLATVNDVLGLPRPFHEAVVQWAVHSIQMREQDFNGAYATKRDLQELMQTLRNQGEMMLDEEQSGMTVWG